MTSQSRKRVYVCEKGLEFRTVLETALPTQDVSVTGFSRYQDCVDRLTTSPCDVLILDLESCEPEGIAALERMRRMAPWIAIVAVVGQAAIPCAVKAIKAGASDCLDKPVRSDRLLAAVGLHLGRAEAAPRRRTRALTSMEIRILQLILAGRTSQEIATELHRSKRTIDVHRKNLMAKLQVDDLVGLIKRAIEMGCAAPPGSSGEQPCERVDESGYVAE